ncbi:U2 small nuclear ribonucleoprotein auxiliary factor 35 kDa subunit-related protein 2 [Bufo gargarizans]|uniref:U2 small nuclear ribonucleoprotein auxiliary factor 35 kDa subunit-related protein 2 n=1 Tax=Bufo gargarizans TaxID=30331 RepID=UPI001CF4CC78|nr:U2 small nuclear ribonucleoprotein auxiliary factor 35 kDa subunit-related protein 2 [Bufo gargarizans]
MAASVQGLSEAALLNHKKSRSLLKKERRKKKRRALAQLRDAEENKEQVSTEDEDDLQEEIERQRLHEEWLARETKAQEEFKLKMEKEEAARRREEEERKMIEEWRQQELKEKAEAPEQLKKREREEAVQKMLDEAETQLENGVWHNPEAPEGYGTEKDRANCPFYLKTGACRFGERCSRKHCFPSSSQTLLVRGMFVTFGMEQCRRDDYDTDASLEYGDDEIYQQFLEFYDDVVPEFKNVGKVIQFKISCNFEPHLRGNVYVQYQTEEECFQALSQFNGRWYAGRQLQCELSPVTKWKSAICGLFERQKCPRGKHCNFLHVFRNPNNEFWEANRDLNTSPDRSNHSERRDRSSRYEDHGMSRRYHSPSPDFKRNGDSSRRKKIHHKSKKKKHRSRSLRSRRRSRSRSRKKRKHKSRSSSRSRSRSKSSSRSKSRSRKSRSRSRSRSRGRKRSKSRERSPQSP